MENKRAQTLEALSVFIQTQKALLSRTQSDIERLRKLKNETVAQPTGFLSNLSEELHAHSFKLSEQVDCALGIPDNVDWSVYAANDPTPLKALAMTTRQAYAQRNQPYPTQRSELSDLQKFVKEARRRIVDPVLAEFARVSELQPQEEEEEIDIDPEEVQRERERDRIRKLKRRKICGGLTIPFRSRGPSGVFIRRDLDDESADVDISFDGDHEQNQTKSECVPMDVDTPTTSTSLPSLTWPPLPPPPTPNPIALSKSSRTRRPSTKRQAQELDAHNGPPRRKVKTLSRMPEPEPTTPHPQTPTVEKRSRESAKPKPETYKLRWSVSEQHLLERLLEEIPDGENNRWQKISRAMNGRRTPRQVASRVQKYFEKLERFGIGVNAAGRGGGNDNTAD